ncbi:MAG: FAD-binding oxidoreductase [Cyanobacteria bacterium P01_H01_bin.74]
MLAKNPEKFQEVLSPYFSSGLAHYITTNNNATGIQLIPDSAQGIASILSWANDAGIQLAMQANDLRFMKNSLWLNLSGIQVVRKHMVDDFMITVEAGISIGKLEAVLAKENQTWGLQYPSAMCLADILHLDCPALASGFKGLPRDSVLKVEVATPDGKLTISGADVVKNATGYDLAKLHCGAYGAFGVITAVTLKVFPKPVDQHSFVYHCQSFDEVNGLTQTLVKQHLPFNALEIIRQPNINKTHKNNIKEQGPIKKTSWQVAVGLSSTIPLSDDILSGLPDSAIQGGQLEAQEKSDQKKSENILEAPIKRTYIKGPIAIDYDCLLKGVNACQTVVGIYLPVSAWPNLLNALNKLSILDTAYIAARPALGQVIVAADSLPYTTLQFLSKEATQLDGFLKVIQVSESDRPILLTSEKGLRQFNSPQTPVITELLKNLKQAYDPKHCLFTPFLPLF